ncbi:hypothetical protein E2562_007183 [Oryza meyeriana var. granulata]|uniref:Uncharacterized protein n=1 Tax=Oryza meyeriana var. granulata TaxID=110450 RepID=A0A6G1CDT1_9ORYZ|nr:hypothetical protein E2562_007183 [Oryza meyeriana var. granulata]
MSCSAAASSSAVNRCGEDDILSASAAGVVRRARAPSMAVAVVGDWIGLATGVEGLAAGKFRVLSL